MSRRDDGLLDSERDDIEAEPSPSLRGWAGFCLLCFAVLLIWFH